MVNKEKTLEELLDELNEIKSSSHYNPELHRRKIVLESRIKSISSECSLRLHEVSDTRVDCDTQDVTQFDQDSFDDESYGYISNSFIDPSKYY